MDGFRSILELVQLHRNADKVSLFGPLGTVAAADNAYVAKLTGQDSVFIVLGGTIDWNIAEFAAQQHLDNLVVVAVVGCGEQCDTLSQSLLAFGWDVWHSPLNDNEKLKTAFADLGERTSTKPLAVLVSW